MTYVCCPACGVFEGACLDREGNAIATHASRIRLIDRQLAQPVRVVNAQPHAITVDHLTYMKERHNELRAANLCINGPRVGTVGKTRRVEHGPVVQAGRCQRCLDVKRKTH